MNAKFILKCMGIVTFLSLTSNAMANSNDVDAISFGCDLQGTKSGYEKKEFYGAIDKDQKLVSYKINEVDKAGKEIFRESKVSTYIIQNDNLIFSFSNGDKFQLSADMLTKQGLAKGSYKGKNFLCGLGNTFAKVVDLPLEAYKQFKLPGDEKRIDSVVHMFKSWTSRDKKIKLDFEWNPFGTNYTSLNLQVQAYYQANIERFGYLDFYNPENNIKLRVRAHILVENINDVLELREIFKSQSKDGVFEQTVSADGNDNVTLTVDCSANKACLILLDN